MKSKGIKRISFDQQKTKCRQFLALFDDYSQNTNSNDQPIRKYMAQLQNIANLESKSLEILIEDLQGFFRKEEDRQFLACISSNTKRYMDMFYLAATEIMPSRNTRPDIQEDTKQKMQNALKYQRRQNYNNINRPIFEQNEIIPKTLEKDFDVSIVYGPNSKIKPKAICQLSAQQIGSLIVIKAIVVRASQIKPQILVATYACDVCGCQNYQEIHNNNYTPLDRCMSKRCVENKVAGKLSFISGHSKFQSYQELKIQQTPDQLRDGRIPRTYSLILKESQVKTAVPGDIILVQGVLLPKRKTGYRHQHDICFQCNIEAVKVTKQKRKYYQMSEIANINDLNQIEGIRASLTQSQLFEKMAKSIAPQIFGMQTVKKSLLLMMAGGVTKQTHDNMKIRGEINVALVGDPGIAKSQLLKHISYLAPRAVYTTGKGSTGVGLTAAVVTDMNSKQLALQAGALVLADMGICCIDQFDKMQQYDRTAIHQVMQQQTVSIAKAGITTTLNARCSVLAAANPLYGRYNKRQSVQKNINLPAALLSRFDLIFILLDQSDSIRDMELARHIGNVHKNGKFSNESEVFSARFLRTYISMAKRYEPVISQQLHSVLTQHYINKRQEQSVTQKQGEKYTTMRSLLAMIRLCQARARLRFSDRVNEQDIAECLQILEESQKNLGLQQNDRRPVHDFKSRIFEMIREVCSYSTSRSVEIDMIRKRILARGFSEDKLQETIRNYIDLSVIMVQNQVITLIQ